MDRKWEKGCLFVKMMTMESKKVVGMDIKNDGRYWNLWGIKLFGNSVEEVLKDVIQYVTKKPKKPFWIATVNPEFVVKATEDKGFYEILQKTDLNVVDGVGLIWARLVVGAQCIAPVQKLYKGFLFGMEIMRGQHREGLITGVDLMERMCEEAGKNKTSAYFFGGWGDRAEKTAEYMKNKYPGMVVAGYADEDFDFGTTADFLFVARGMKKQEEWIEANFDKLKVGAVMGVGRSFDYFSGDLIRAPEVVRKMGFEWLYSLYKEPKRWRRQLALPKFLAKVIFG